MPQAPCCLCASPARKIQAGDTRLGGVAFLGEMWEQTRFDAKLLNVDASTQSEPKKQQRVKKQERDVELAEKLGQGASAEDTDDECSGPLLRLPLATRRPRRGNGFSRLWGIDVS